MENDVTILLARVSEGDRGARDALLELVYSELRQLARGVLNRNPGNATLEPTILAHDAYMKLVGDSSPASYSGRRHFFSVAAKAMRQLVTDHARARLALKRGGGNAAQRVTLSEAVAASVMQDVDIIALDEALTKLTELDERQAQIVELRFFVGMTIEETAVSLGLGETAVKDSWRGARAWLRRELSRD